MGSLQNKIDFAIILRVKNANPNGDPLNGNRPRTNYEGFGEITDVCLKRKIRDRLLENGHSILVQSDDRKVDDCKSIRQRVEEKLGRKLSSIETAKLACENWLDVRTFGQLLAFKKNEKKINKSEEETNFEGDTGVSIGIRGPVTIQSAFSLEPISTSSTQITKSVNGEGDGSKRASDTMGMKHRVDYGVYLTYGSMNPQLAVRTGFSDTDAEVIKNILPKLFENDASSARPEGSMEVLKVIWWRHSSKEGKCASSKVHGSLKVDTDGTYRIDQIDGLIPEEINGY